MKYFWLFLAVVVPSLAWADDKCAGNTYEMAECGISAFHEADRKLNLAYEAALKRIDSDLSDADAGQKNDTKKAFVEAERLWIQLRDKDCEAVNAYARDEGIRPLSFWACMIDHTEHRTKELEAFKDYR
jgi:uncharacterized protein YecT (DUF1311 family)